MNLTIDPIQNIISPMKAKRTPEQREAIKRAYWDKWCPGGDPEKVLRTKGITNDVWYTITNVTNITSDEFDNATGKQYNRTMIKQRKRTREDIQRIQDLRRSNASAKYKNKKKYDRKNQDWKKGL